jgi:hypothetical protein
LVIIFAIVYCLSFTCIMLYPFTGAEYRANSEQFLFIYNSFWGYASAALFIYVILSSDNFTLKKA